MKTFKILICTLLIFSQLHAQTERSAFRKGYTRIGISTLGSTLDNNLSPKENVFNGNYGAGNGYVFESGHIYYFKPKTKSKINYGLDWTILSATYNKLDKWNAYATASKNTASTDGADISVSVASKLGPVISFNPFEKLVIDARLQVAAIARATPFEYYEYTDNTMARSFAFYNYGEEDVNPDYDASSIKNIISFGMGSNFGISIRRKAIGLSLDYTAAKAKINYDAYDANNNHTYGTQKVPTHSLQLKLSLTF